jgi:hypothetical protein
MHLSCAPPDGHRRRVFGRGGPARPEYPKPKRITNGTGVDHTGVTANASSCVIDMSVHAVNDFVACMAACR